MAAHSNEVTELPLSPLHSAMMPSVVTTYSPSSLKYPPILFLCKLHKEGACQWALTQKRTLWGGGALERGHGAPLEPLAQLDDALRGVGALALPIDAAEPVFAQAAKGRRSVNGH